MWRKHISVAFAIALALRGTAVSKRGICNSASFRLVPVIDISRRCHHKWVSVFSGAIFWQIIANKVTLFLVLAIVMEIHVFKSVPWSTENNWNGCLLKGNFTTFTHQSLFLKVYCICKKKVYEAFSVSRWSCVASDKCSQVMALGSASVGAEEFENVKNTPHLCCSLEVLGYISSY